MHFFFERDGLLELNACLGEGKVTLCTLVCVCVGVMFPRLTRAHGLFMWRNEHLPSVSSGRLKCILFALMGIIWNPYQCRLP